MMVKLNHFEIESIDTSNLHHAFYSYVGGKSVACGDNSGFYEIIYSNPNLIIRLYTSVDSLPSTKSTTNMGAYNPYLAFPIIRRFGSILLATLAGDNNTDTKVYHLVSTDSGATWTVTSTTINGEVDYVARDVFISGSDYYSVYVHNADVKIFKWNFTAYTDTNLIVNTGLTPFSYYDSVGLGYTDASGDYCFPALIYPVTYPLGDITSVHRKFTISTTTFSTIETFTGETQISGIANFIWGMFRQRSTLFYLGTNKLRKYNNATSTWSILTTGYYWIPVFDLTGLNNEYLKYIVCYAGGKRITYFITPGGLASLIETITGSSSSGMGCFDFYVSKNGDRLCEIEAVEKKNNVNFAIDEADVNAQYGTYPVGQIYDETPTDLWTFRDGVLLCADSGNLIFTGYALEDKDEDDVRYVPLESFAKVDWERRITVSFPAQKLSTTVKALLDDQCDFLKYTASSIDTSDTATYPFVFADVPFGEIIKMIDILGLRMFRIHPNGDCYWNDGTTDAGVDIDYDTDSIDSVEQKRQLCVYGLIKVYGGIDDIGSRYTAYAAIATAIDNQVKEVSFPFIVDQTTLDVLATNIADMFDQEISRYYVYAPNKGLLQHGKQYDFHYVGSKISFTPAAKVYCLGASFDAVTQISEPIFSTHRCYPWFMSESQTMTTTPTSGGNNANEYQIIGATPANNEVLIQQLNAKLKDSIVQMNAKVANVGKTCRMYKDVAQNAGAAAVVVFDHTDYNADSGIFTPDPTVAYTIKVLLAGMYMISYYVGFSPCTADKRYLTYIKKNAGYITYCENSPSVAGSDVHHTLGVPVKLAANDVLSIWCYSNQATAIYLAGVPWFQVTYLGPV